MACYPVAMARLYPLPTLLLSAACAMLPAQEQQQQLVEVHHAANWDESAPEGLCEIRVWVAEEAEIEFRWDKYSIQAPRGGEAFDANSSCNRPLNTSGLADFKLLKQYGRGTVTLVQGAKAGGDEPVIIRVRDQAAGTGAYHFRLSWSYAAAAPPTEGNASFAARKQGSGHCNIGGQEMNFTRSEISLRPGGSAQISLYGDTLLQVMGRWRRVDDRIELDITNARGMRGAKAQGQIMGRMEGDRLVDYSSVSFSGMTGDGKGLDATFNAQ